ncbi:hypothetical protein BWQ96_07287 [Gracilariopsis chorda]|uniref:Uncharacterized protein n=1 Tax=Gracilariopsis chorda TaxID=448386 RepID=A0A2V3ILQ0_9FLOR|nr:hypothetical protein BWQ96_07287 [Gracilariopsis chorda]|eukprot:PXF42983.1 hypothetical protein BWQ96_07287 [Gracilariopsis chorda]
MLWPFFLSYNVTERYRQSFIVKRERNGPRDYSSMNERSLPILEFDNWGIKPLHAVKLDGKAMLKVNGSLLQKDTFSKKRKKEDTERDAVTSPRLGSWRNADSFGSREQFIVRVNSVEILREYSNLKRLGLGLSHCAAVNCWEV